MRHGMQAEVPKRCGQHQGALATRDRTVQVPCQQAVMAHPYNGPPQPTLVTQRLGKRYGCVQDVVEPSIFAERQERPIQMLAEINGLLQRVAALREVLQGYQRLLQAGHGFLVGGTLHGISGGVAQILHGACGSWARVKCMARTVAMVGA